MPTHIWRELRQPWAYKRSVKMSKKQYRQRHTRISMMAWYEWNSSEMSNAIALLRSIILLRENWRTISRVFVPFALRLVRFSFEFDAFETAWVYIRLLSGEYSDVKVIIALLMQMMMMRVFFDSNNSTTNNTMNTASENLFPLAQLLVRTDVCVPRGR